MLEGHSDLLARLSSLNLSLAVCLTAGSSLAHPATAVPDVWGASGSATVEVADASSDQIRNQALEEINATLAILRLEGLSDEPAFAAFLKAVDNSLTYYEKQLVPGHGALLILRNGLLSARTMLRQEIISLANWLTLVRVTEPRLEQFVSVPARFVTQASINADTPLSAEEFNEIDHLTQLVGV